MPASELTFRREDKQLDKYANEDTRTHIDAMTVLGDPFAASSPDSRWIQVGKIWDFPKDGGATIKYGKTQIAVFNFDSRGEWYATQNMCPHKREFVLSRGIVGDQNGTPKVACPVHKKTYSLETGNCLDDKEFAIQVFPVRVEGDDVYLQLPSVENLDAQFATERCQHC